MSYLLLSAALMLPIFAQDSPPAGKDVKEGKLVMQKIDGEWDAVYVEIDGKKVENKKFNKVSIKNNVVICQHDGKEMSWKLDFGPHHMVRATEQPGTATAVQPGNGETKQGSHTHYGTYIASQEYFCLCLNKGQDKRFGERREGNEAQPRGAARTFETHPPSGAGMIIILHRTSSGADKTQ